MLRLSRAQPFPAVTPHRVDFARVRCQAPSGPALHSHSGANRVLSRCQYCGLYGSQRGIEYITAGETKAAADRPETAEYRVFAELCRRGFYVTAGTKYGCDFLLYPSDPDECHAQYMVFVLPGTPEIGVNSLVTFERMAESNRKTAVLAWVADGTVKLMRVSQWLPDKPAASAAD